MNKTLILAILMLVTSVAAIAGNIDLGTYLVDPKGTFLMTNQDAADGPLILQLGNCGSLDPNASSCVSQLSAGSIITLTAVGGICFHTGPGCTTSNESAPPIAGVFDVNSNVGPASGVQNRVTGGIAASTFGQTSLTSGHGAGSATSLYTYIGGLNTDINSDFWIPPANGVTLTIPNGARFLILGALDSEYSDNGDPSHTLGVDIQVDPVVPEPATWTMMITGVALTLAARRRRA
jgi:hypothetical protein